MPTVVLSVVMILVTSVYYVPEISRSLSSGGVARPEQRPAIYQGLHLPWLNGGTVTLSPTISLMLYL